LWIACTNPAQSMPDQSTVRRALERAEFVLVQEAFATTATCDYADLLLPATTWGEKTGTVTNSERRISRVRPATPKPAETRHDWAIAVEFARRLELQLRPGQTTLFPYSLADETAGAEAIWNEHRETTRGRDLDITGMSYSLLDERPLQWPMPSGHPEGKARLYEDGVFPTSDGKARFANVAWRPLAEPRESRYPFSLTTGRLRDQWHGMSRTGTLGRLFGHVAEPAVQMNPQDMARHLLKDGDLVHVTSRRGSIVVPVQGSTELGMSQAFIAMHWGAEFLTGCSSTGKPLAGVNAITTSACCPISKQPELKHAAVKILKAELPWSLLGAAWLPEDEALQAREQLKEVMARFPFASCVPFGRERPGVLLRAAAHETPPEHLIERIEELLGLDSPNVLRYADSRKGQRRAMRLVRRGEEARLEAFLLAGDTSAQAWIKTLLQDELPAQAYGRMLLVPGAKAPVAVQSRGKQVCTCLNVTDAAIHAHLGGCVGSQEERLASLQSSLECGTSCGSCVPELRRMVHSMTPLKQAA
ncbi:MAG TPA: molybdopterin dinucleotide binding domain-containing protein, partial [Ramlibacter sp.]|nr:molybdopterin dinucleotide binding domain-containing protein [Ramlibacter sp.]